MQVLTGIALALYYAPTPDHAWDSVRFITTSVRGGSFLRGLHHWGASVVVVAAVIHLFRVVFFGSYRKPREVNWIVGLVLLLVILGVRPDGLPAAVGSARVLGDGRRDQHFEAHAGRRRVRGHDAARRRRHRRADADALVRAARARAAGRCS